LFVVC